MMLSSAWRWWWSVVRKGISTMVKHPSLTNSCWSTSQCVTVTQPECPDPWFATLESPPWNDQSHPQRVLATLFSSKKNKKIVVPPSTDQLMPFNQKPGGRFWSPCLTFPRCTSGYRQLMSMVCVHVSLEASCELASVMVIFFSDMSLDRKQRSQQPQHPWFIGTSTWRKQMVFDQGDCFFCMLNDRGDSINFQAG